MTADISVVITAYNREHEIGRAIESVLKQTLSPLEIIVVDDASTDRTVDIVKSLDCSNIMLIENQTNLGIAGAKNVGVKIASGTYVCFLDSDDCWLPTKLERQFLALQEAGRDTICFCAVNLHRQNGKTITRKPKLFGTWRDSALMGESFNFGSTFMGATSVFEEMGLLNEKLQRFDDREWVLRYLLEGRTIVVVDEQLVDVFNSGWPASELVLQSSNQLLDQFKHSNKNYPKRVIDDLEKMLEIEVSVALFRSGSRLVAVLTMLKVALSSYSFFIYFLYRVFQKSKHLDFA